MALRDEFTRTTPKLQAAIEQIGTSGFPVTSIIGGSIHKGSGHRDGRAIDIGIPRTQAGYNYVIRAIQSGQFSAIGTDKQIVDLLQPMAKQYGVNLFEDDEATGASGLHAHLEVAP